jgi:hypothetical protein
MANPRRDLAKAQYDAQTAIDALFRPLAPEIGAIVRRRAVDGMITADARTLILHDVDALLSDVFPKKRGAPSKLQALIEQHARQAALLPVRDAVAIMRRHVPDELRKAMGDTK